MTFPGPSNVIARRVIKDLIDFNAQTARNYLAQLTALVAKIEAMDDSEEVFDTLMCLKDDIREENSKLLELNGAIIQAEERIAITEEHMKIMEAGGDDV
nr:hypothetical protein [Tanacetum cinerariifolium]